MPQKLNKDKVYIISVVLVSLFLVVSWFRIGYMISYAEEGFLFYRPDLIIQKFKYLWADAGFGQPNPFYYPRLPLLYFSNMLRSVGLTPLITQAVVFFLLILTPLLSMPILVKELGYKKIVGYGSALFYLFNLFTMSQVWGRFILPMIFVWSYLPLFTYLWIKLMKENELKYLFYLLISTLMFSYSFGIPSTLLVIFIPIILYMFVSILRSEDKLRKIFSYISYIAVWCLFNLWWIYPAIVVSKSSIAVYLDGGSSIESLQAVSYYYPLSEIAVLKQKYLFDDNLIFSFFYSTEAATIVSYSILFIAFVGLVHTLKKYRENIFLVSLSLISFFIVKGANPPFGIEIFEAIFRLFPPSQVLRNPYEKAGVIFVFVYSVLFAVGTVRIARLSKRKFLVYLSVAVTAFVWYMQPFWKGFVFPSHAYVSVPNYYEEADNYLKRSEGRILQMPLVISDGVEYDWRYRGGQHLDQMFTRPIISDPGIAQTDPFYHLMRNSVKNRNFGNILSILNIRHIIINNDLVITNPHDIRVSESYGLVENWRKTVKDERFGSLDIYRYEGDVSEDVYAAAELLKAETLKQGFKIFLTEDFNAMSQAVYVAEQNIDNNIPLKKYDLIPEVEFRRISPKRYLVYIMDAKAPFYLILTETINPLWTANVDGKEINDKFVANGFANGWYIDKSGSYTIEVNFEVWPW